MVRTKQLKKCSNRKESNVHCKEASNKEPSAVDGSNMKMDNYGAEAWNIQYRIDPNMEKTETNKDNQYTSIAKPRSPSTRVIKVGKAGYRDNNIAAAYQVVVQGTSNVQPESSETKN